MNRYNAQQAGGWFAAVAAGSVTAVRIISDGMAIIGAAGIPSDLTAWYRFVLQLLDRSSYLEWVFLVVALLGLGVAFGWDPMKSGRTIVAAVRTGVSKLGSRPPTEAFQQDARATLQLLTYCTHHATFLMLEDFAAQIHRLLDPATNDERSSLLRKIDSALFDSHRYADLKFILNQCESKVDEQLHTNATSARMSVSEVLTHRNEEISRMQCEAVYGFLCREKSELQHEMIGQRNQLRELLRSRDKTSA